jgi:predicted metalloendopeptidase
MAADLLTVYKRIIKRNRWLSPSTKKYALLKTTKVYAVIKMHKGLEKMAVS